MRQMLRSRCLNRARQGSKLCDKVQRPKVHKYSMALYVIPKDLHPLKNLNLVTQSLNFEMYTTTFTMYMTYTVYTVIHTEASMCEIC